MERNKKKAEEKRFAVVGTSCSGKTTFAARLADILSIPHIEMDRLHWGPNWTPRTDFTAKLQKEIARTNWVADGNYHSVRDLVFARAHIVFWLNFSFWLVFWRALKRTIPHVFTGKEIYAGNKETFSITFFSSDSILWWVIKTHKQRRKEYSQLFASKIYDNVRVIELKHPQQAEQYLKQVKAEYEI